MQCYLKEMATGEKSQHILPSLTDSVSGQYRFSSLSYLYQMTSSNRSLPAATSGNGQFVSRIHVLILLVESIKNLTQISSKRNGKYLVLATEIFRNCTDFRCGRTNGLKCSFSSVSIFFGIVSFSSRLSPFDNKDGHIQLQIQILTAL